MKEPKNWKGNRYKTKCCDDTVQSQYSGQFVRCKCGQIAIDDTPYYTRTIGNPDLLELIWNNKTSDMYIYTGEENEK